MGSSANAVIFLDRNGFLFFAGGMDRVLQFNFAPNVVRDLEVIDQDTFASQLTAFVNQMQIQPFQGVILLSDGLLFDKQFNPPLTEENKDVSVFLDNLPFEHVGKILLPTENRCIATNKELYRVMISCFETLHSTVLTVLPAFAVDMDATKMVSLNSSLASEIFRKSVASDAYNFLKDKALPKPQPVIRDTSSDQQAQNSQNENVVKTEEGDKGRLFLLLGVFGIMMAILAVVAYLML